jgi:hypothetical protein
MLSILAAAARAGPAPRPCLGLRLHRHRGGAPDSPAARPASAPDPLPDHTSLQTVVNRETRDGGRCRSARRSAATAPPQRRRRRCSSLALVCAAPPPRRRRRRRRARHSAQRLHAALFCARAQRLHAAPPLCPALQGAGRPAGRCAPRTGPPLALARLAALCPAARRVPAASARSPPSPALPQRSRAARLSGAAVAPSQPRRRQARRRAIQRAARARCGARRRRARKRKNGGRGGGW